MFRPFFRQFRVLFLTAFLALPAAGADTPPVIAAAAPQDSMKLSPVDSVRLVRDSLHDDAPDSTYRWPKNPWAIACADPLEGLAQCWRSSPRRVLQETGFPGIRASGLDLESLEPTRLRPFFQGAFEESPYRAGGLMPFARYEEAEGLEEGWAPVQPLDTPVTHLHWMRGALFLNQFTLRMERMVGNRAYLGLEYHSDGSESEAYQYAFNVHQPYLGAFGRDSLSLVITDTSHLVSARQVRPRLGFWLGPRTVVELYGDFFSSRTSLTNPTNPDRNDSAQSLYPVRFSASTFGAVAAHAGETHHVQALFRHAAWSRGLDPRFVSGDEQASGMTDLGRVDWTLPRVFGTPRLRLEAQNTFHDHAYWTAPAGDSQPPEERKRGDRERLELEARPAWGPLALELRGDGARRHRPDGEDEWLGGANARALLDLPFGFSLDGRAGRDREGAPDELLFRRQPALGLYPADLDPRTVLHYGGGAAWESRYLGFGAGWDRNEFRNTWLPRTLPVPEQGSLPDSLSLARMNYEKETRELLQLSMFARLGNWKLSLWQTHLLMNEVTDPRLTAKTFNWQLPEDVLKGQLLWKRRLLDDKMALRTQWDWEWFSERYVYASDLDGSSRVLKLDEYLVLDFTVSMEVRTFLVYFRAMNMNHDRYAPEPGVHPPGINFRFGVDWKIRN
jgi:hypothetical protein